MKPITKSAKQIIDARNIPAQVRDGFRMALEERPGAARILSCPRTSRSNELQRIPAGAGDARFPPVAPDAAVRRRGDLIANRAIRWS